MSTARQIMHLGAECVSADDAVIAAAKRMRDSHVGALPICGADGKLRGIITDRDIVVRCVAEGFDPHVLTAGELALGTPVWVDADADETEVLQTMEKHKIRRVPVLDERRLVGMISEADLATHLDEQQISEFAAAIYGAPPSS